MKAEKQKNWPMAFAAYTEAAQQDATKPEYLLRREFARSELVSASVDRAERDALTGHLAEAREELDAALVLDPSDEMVRERLAQLAPSSAAALRQLMTEARGRGATGAADWHVQLRLSGRYDERIRSSGARLWRGCLV